MITIHENVFISLGMSGRDDEDVRNDIDRLFNLYKTTVHKDSEVTTLKCIHNLEENDVEGESPLFYLGRAIQKLRTANVIVFAKDWKEHRGCVIEHKVAEVYKIPFYEESYDSNALYNQHLDYIDTPRYTYLAYAHVVGCEVGSGYSGWAGYTLCKGNNMTDILEHYNAQTGSKLKRGGMFSKYDSSSYSTMPKEFIIFDYFPIHFVKLENEIYGHSEPLKIEFPYKPHKE